MEYTKGEWERHNAPNGEHIWCGNTHIADLDGENAKANAHLIAAAPRMYEALKEIINGEDSIPPYMAETINKAMAKAEGK